MELKGAVGTKEVAVAAVASEDTVKARQVDGMAVGGREMAVGRWAAQQEEELCNGARNPFRATQARRIFVHATSI